MEIVEDFVSNNFCEDSMVVKVYDNNAVEIISIISNINNKRILIWNKNRIHNTFQDSEHFFEFEMNELKYLLDIGETHNMLNLFRAILYES